MAEEIQEFSKSFLLEQTPLTIQETRALLPLPKESSIPNIFPTSYSLPLQNTEMGVEPLTLDDEAYEAWSINNATDIVTTPNKSPGSMLPPQTPPLSPSNSISDAGSPTSFLFSPTRNNTGGVGSPKAPSKKRPIDLEESDSSEAQPPSTKRKVETPVKKNVIDSITVHSTPPRNKSVQQAAHAKSFKKLSSPFRSPLLVAPPAASSASSTSKTIASTSSFAMPKALTSKPAHDSGLFSKLKGKQPSSGRAPSSSPSSKATPSSSKLSKPFKSPFKSPLLSQKPSKIAQGIQIQALEQKLQLLKQAHKIKTEGSEKKLENLASKWRKVAQEAASDLWDLVKANEGNFSPGGDQDRDNEFLDDGKAQFGFTSHWGWADDDEKKPSANEEDEDAGNLSDSSLPSPSALVLSSCRSVTKSSSSRSTTLMHAYKSVARDSDLEDEEQGKKDRGSEEPEPAPEPKWTMGTMLGVLGIAAKDTLRWNEEEEEFANP